MRLQRIDLAPEPSDGPSGSAALWSRPGYLVRRLHQIGVAIFLEEMDALPLTPVQFGALTIISERPGIEQSVLGQELGIDRVNVGDVVLRLINNGFARREVSTRDRRFKEVFLTAAGETLMTEGLARLKTVQDRLLQPLQPEQREVFLELLMVLIDGNNGVGRAPLQLAERG